MPIVSRQKQWLIGLLLGVCAMAPAVAADDIDRPISNCLKAWGEHPFGKNPQYKILSTSVKVFGIGPATIDAEPTNAPVLVLVNPSVYVAGGSEIQVLNPNGWYCFRTTVSVIGGLTINAHCKSHLATTSGDLLTVGNAAGDKGVTVMGSTQVERVGCD